MNQTKARLYFVQDYEPDFYSQEDSQHQDAERTYSLALRKVGFGKYLGMLFTRRDHLPVTHLKFSVNRSIFANRHVRTSGNPVRILFFARPGLTRRAYPVGVDALRLVAQACPDVQIAFYGMAQREDVGFNYQNLGELNQSDVAEAMNASHIHLSFSLSNISWVPFEAMACGCCVVEARVPSVEVWMEGAGQPCLLVDPNPMAVAEGLMQLVSNSELRQ